MERKQLERTEQEKVFVIDIHLNHGLIAAMAIALLFIAGVGYLALGMDSVSASSPQAVAAGTTGLRQYYLSTGTVLVDGSDATTACASGYHMASLWEIYEPSNLEYNIDLGATADDSGLGPAASYGWVRTGWGANTGVIPGQANCNAWTSNDVGHNGTLVKLESDWQHPSGIPNWYSIGDSCNKKYAVWCIED